MYEDGKINKLAIVKDWTFYLKNPKALTVDYKESKWKEGYIKQLLPFIRRPDKKDKLIKSKEKKYVD